MSTRYEPEGVTVRKMNPVKFRTTKQDWIIEESKRRSISQNKLVNEIFEMGMKQYEESNAQ
jgi:hypothetical protein